MKIAVIMPVFNEADVIEKVIKRVPKKLPNDGWVKVFVVDDGSDDNSSQIARRAGATVLRHPINLGVGAATITGIRAALMLGADVLVTIDSDGQHDPLEIKKLVSPIVKDGYDFVIGSRFKVNGQKKAPWHRLLGNYIMNIITFCFYGVWASDTQSGFKAFSRKAAQSMQLSFFGYEICSEMIGEIKKRKLRYREVPIKIIYSDYSLRKGQSPLNAINILLRMISRIILGGHK